MVFSFRKDRKCFYNYCKISFLFRFFTYYLVFFNMLQTKRGGTDLPYQHCKVMVSNSEVAADSKLPVLVSEFVNGKVVDCLEHVGFPDVLLQRL